MPAGKLLHAFALTWETSPRYDPFEADSDPVEISPLVSQPLIELSLSIPTYALTHDGRDRAVARRAFADSLPLRIVRRKSKGGQEEHVKDILLSNRELVHDMLVNGQLVRNGYLDNAALQQALLYSPSQFKCDPGELMSILFLEAWLSSSSRENRRAAA
jgi:asparagine synthase (glutamine-hydrolysing)